MKKVLALVLALMLILPAVALAEDVIKVGVFEPVTGENGGGGFQEVLGMRYANQVAPTVDIGGKSYKVELVEVDNKSDKTEAVTAAQSLIASGVSVVLGSYGSGVSIAAGGIFADAHVAAIGASCTNPQVTLGNDYYFGPAEKSDSRYGRSFKQLLVLSQPILQSNLRSSARAKKELKGSAAGAQRSLPG